MSKYNRIYSDLLASITTERLERGARLPSETELMDSYQASRGTVRKAIELLQERGFAQKVHGKGTFVLSSAPIEFQLGGIVSFQETYPRLGTTSAPRWWSSASFLSKDRCGRTCRQKKAAWSPGSSGYGESTASG